MQLHNGDCLDVMRAMDANSVDTVVCDPPYGLSFMGKNWDHGVPGVAFWQAALQVAKPGAMLLAFGGTRTHHRLMVAIEDAGWEIRDVIMWVYGSGFPKSHDISKGIDKAAGAEREVIGGYMHGGSRSSGIKGNDMGQQWHSFTAPATDAAQQWHGWGTALKPAWEPIIVAMKPLDGTFAQNAARHGVAGLNIDGSRIGTTKNVPASVSRKVHANTYNGGWKEYGETSGVGGHDPNIGRWPANLILDEEAARLLDEQSGERKGGAFSRSGIRAMRENPVYGKPNTTRNAPDNYADTGGASRFFYCAKASRREREEGLEGMPEQQVDESREPDAPGANNPRNRGGRTTANNHPTVKPLSLMRYLVRLTSTPTGGVVLDPFMGSGTTGVACMQTGRNFIGVEIDPGYFAIAKKRIEDAAAQPPLIPHESEPQHEQEALWP